MSSNNVRHLITSTITTLQTLRYTSPNYTSLHLSTLHFFSFTLPYPLTCVNPFTFTESQKWVRTAQNLYHTDSFPATRNKGVVQRRRSNFNFYISRNIREQSIAMVLSHSCITLFRPISVSVSFREELRCHDVRKDSRLEFLTPDRIPIRTLSLCLVPGRRHYGYGCSGNSVSLNVRDGMRAKARRGSMARLMLLNRVHTVS
jgi:hypothetical protein